jgi:hypothetical protein
LSSNPPFKRTGFAIISTHHRHATERFSSIGGSSSSTTTTTSSFKLDKITMSDS